MTAAHSFEKQRTRSRHQADTGLLLGFYSCNLSCIREHEAGEKDMCWACGVCSVNPDTEIESCLDLHTWSMQPGSIEGAGGDIFTII